MDRIKAQTGRRKTTRDARRAETRRALLDAARELFSEYGYEEVSVTEIGKVAGVSHSLINAYFGGKAGLLYELVRENNAPQWAEIERIAGEDGPPLERLRRVLEATAEADLDDPRLCAVLQSYSWLWPAETEAENRADRAVLKASLAALVREGQAEGTVRAELDPDRAGPTIFALYTWALRPGVFEDLAPAACIDRLWPQIEDLLGSGGVRTTRRGGGTARVKA